MASKFGGAQASKNQWVMQQNMARHKSILGYSHKPRQPKPPAAKPQPPVTPPTVAETTSETND
jgi:hypothetical protein